MFGYVTVNEKALSESDRKRYAGYYCGVCHALSERGGVFAKLTLTYDITFLALILDLCFGDKTKTKTGRCIQSPIKAKTYCKSDIIDYCADMNIVLAYYNLLDDWADDSNVLAKLYADALEKSFENVKQRYPDKCETIGKCLEELTALENGGCSNADEVSDKFGEILGCVFRYGDEMQNELYDFGHALGKFIYMADACIDLRKDLKKRRYNPLTFTEIGNFDLLLNTLMSDCDQKLAKIKSVYSDEIVKNVMYSGIWIKYEISKARKR